MADRTPTLDDPEPLRRRVRNPLSGDTFGRGAEGFARFMGTPAFLVGMTLFCAVWLAWNSIMPESAQFDPRSLNFTLLTLILSLQASYAAPLLLLAQNRQDDRDRVQAEQDRQSNDRNHATTDFITREIASLRIALNDVATRDFVRGELRDLLEDLEKEREDADGSAAGAPQAAAGQETAASTGVPGVDREELRSMLRSEVRAALAERDAS
ncbi:DUF1003 domain-containing protein [Brachybacterium subflavum]|uniref:DUF1003 domain-containing protein n=1 Tax=Brachybacterium subflavum TaxID=2585206 RepID=UPI001266568C|nr:DUF1003 domain-containing protein [Brachybacterium subflavum]